MLYYSMLSCGVFRVQPAQTKPPRQYKINKIRKK